MKKDYRFDLIRALAIVMVVAIHSSVIMFEHCASETTSLLEKIAYSLLEIRFVAVPLFVMISGALLLGKQEALTVFFRKRMARILLPFLVWSLIVFTISFAQEGGRSVSDWLYGFYENAIIGTGAHSIYWYVYMISALYLFAPILRVLFSNINKHQAYYLLIVMFILTEAFLVFPDVYFLKNISSLIFEFLLYFVGGYILYKYVINERWFPVTSKILLVTGALMLSARFLITNSFDAYLHPVRILPAFALCGILLTISPNCKILMGGGKKMISLLSEYSYGIYLSHFLFISVLIRIPFIKNLYPFAEFITVTILTLVLDCLMLWMLKKLRLKKLFM